MVTLTTNPAVAVLSQIRFQQRNTAILWDKDSTLASTEHRHWMVKDIQEGRYTWVDYALRCERDTPIDSARTLMRTLAPYHLQIVTSGAAQEAMVPIGAWLSRNSFPVDMIRLRPEDDECEGGLLKVRMINELRKDGIETVLFIEDNPAQARVIEDMAGVPVLLLNPRWTARSRAIAAETSGSI
jgi:hypothetical protein